MRRHPADGVNFYMARLDAAPELFQLTVDYDALEAFVQSLVEKIEKAADPSIGDGQHTETLQALKKKPRRPRDPDNYRIALTRYPYKLMAPIRPTPPLRARSIEHKLTPDPNIGGA